ncbi:MAG TPA: hypothetical protein PK052_04960 [Anaerohalosphaeraceae bacterium]|nr:hypothetical protein [Anaerohalosphaeraceae bacterium]HOL31312.1 hypothetical protein [Anaerohalosphaeraceae bacterium]HOM77078.1 hypothetical protein [Anaerohalosphaeraceae bacterium]HPC64766.1 hypothetical protein [Anaerohalosphaeraceae bacterium]HRS71798.1 hypothetical protein [Anaerohalosphaeraceae bacterium]
MPYRTNEIHSGMIIMWSGLLSNVPAGWSVCDGTNGTPNLRQKFIRGANAEMGAQGGSASHTHNMESYIGCAQGSLYMVNGGCSCQIAAQGHTHPMYVNAQSSSNIPPYYELIFIRKD